MSRAELQAVLDFILNKADDEEFKVISVACERRIRDKTVFASLGGENPGAMARRMAGELGHDVDATMEGVRGTLRDLVAGIIRKEAPEIGEEKIAALMDEYAPAAKGAEPRAGRGGTAERRAGPAAGAALPPQALLGMVRSFVEYSEGRMAPSRQAELWESDPRWQDSYWTAFPAEIKAIAKAYIEGRIDGDTFGSGLLSILGL